MNNIKFPILKEVEVKKETEEIIITKLVPLLELERVASLEKDA